MRRAQGFGQFQLVRIDIDGHNLPGSGDDGTEQGAQSHPAHPDNGDAASRFDLGRVEDGPRPGDHRTTEEGYFMKGDGGIHFDQGVLIDDGIFGETGHPQMVMDVFASFFNRR